MTLAAVNTEMYRPRLHLSTSVTSVLVTSSSVHVGTEVTEDQSDITDDRPTGQTTDHRVARLACRCV